MSSHDVSATNRIVTLITSSLARPFIPLLFVKCAGRLRTAAPHLIVPDRGVTLCVNHVNVKNDNQVLFVFKQY